MKLSVSIPDEDVEFIDRYAGEHGVRTRSAVVQRALSLLRGVELSDDYAAAWEEWSTSEAELWDATSGDGLGEAAAG
jgi:Arc/MetJ-type ribon-helix-helix transcriptional regulator